MDKSYLKNGIITRPLIVIDETGKWYHNQQEITNGKVLNYFKKCLCRIESNYYIHNQFGEKNEFALIDSVKGFPLQITQIISFDDRLLLIHLDYGDEKTIPVENLLYFNDTTLAVIIPEKNVAARLNGYAMTSLMKDISEDERGLITFGKDRHVIRHGKFEDIFTG